MAVRFGPGAPWQTRRSIQHPTPNIQGGGGEGTRKVRTCSTAAFLIHHNDREVLAPLLGCVLFGGADTGGVAFARPPANGYQASGLRGRCRTFRKVVGRGGGVFCSSVPKKFFEIPRAVQHTHNLDPGGLHALKNDIVREISNDEGPDTRKLAAAKLTSTSEFGMFSEKLANLVSGFQNTVCRLGIVRRDTHPDQIEILKGFAGEKEFTHASFCGPRRVDAGV